VKEEPSMIFHWQHSNWLSTLCSSLGSCFINKAALRSSAFTSALYESHAPTICRLSWSGILIYMETCHGNQWRGLSERRSARTKWSTMKPSRPHVRGPWTRCRKEPRERVREDWRGLRQRSLGEPFFSLWKLLLSYTNVVSKCPFKASALFCFLYLWSGPCPVNNNFVVLLTSIRRLSRKPALTRKLQTFSLIANHLARMRSEV